MQFKMTDIKREYDNARAWREAAKWAFSIGTLGLGALYLWSTTSVVREGEIGIRCNARGEMTLLPPGRHSNFPWENYPEKPQSLAKKEINLGPFKIITVETGSVAKTIKQGAVTILKEGQHLLSEACHVFAGFLPIKQETKKLHAVTAYTSDNVGLTLHADVRYQITDPLLAIQQIDEIENSITEISVISISQIVSHHNLADFAPATANVTGSAHHSISDVISELRSNIKEQLARLGIDLLNIGITSWTINDAALAHELAQGAVIQSQTQSKMISAEREAAITAIETQAKAKANIVLAESEACATRMRGDAIKTVADSLKNDPLAQTIYNRYQDIEMVGHANNPFLLFTMQGQGQALSTTFQLPNRPN